MGQSMSSVCGLSRKKSFILVPKHAALNPHFPVFYISRKQPLQPLSVTPHHNLMSNFLYLVLFMGGKKVLTLRLLDEDQCFECL